MAGSTLHHKDTNYKVWLISKVSVKRKSRIFTCMFLVSVGSRGGGLLGLKGYDGCELIIKYKKPLNLHISLGVEFRAISPRQKSPPRSCGPLEYIDDYVLRIFF